MSASRRTYLSGPVSLGGTLTIAEITRNIRRFRVIREALEAAGVEVVDPTQLSPAEPNPTWLDWMRADLKALLDCDRVLMLPGWEDSRGACVERRLAEDLGIVVEEYTAVMV
jgi:nucleoside 2-deoxyribosyltransferase